MALLLSVTLASPSLSQGPPTDAGSPNPAYPWLDAWRPSAAESDTRGPESEGEEIQEESPPPKPSPSVPAWVSKLRVNGFFTQAYGTAHDIETLGFPSRGTSDYRNAALLLTYKADGNDTLTLQLSHERLGESDFGAFDDDLELDWAYYEHRFRGETSLKVGRIPIPNGIYNEIRDVGTLLPFYRPPVTLYNDEFFATENVDGVLLSHTFFARAPWRMKVDAYYGSWEVLQIPPSPVDVEDAGGVQFWLEAPSVLKLGGGVQRQDMRGLNFAMGPEEQWYEWHASLEARFSRLEVRAETRQIDFEIGEQEAFYAQLGFQATEKLTVNAQFEDADLVSPQSPIMAAPVGRADLYQDFALGVNYSLRDQLVLKLENHWADGFIVGDVEIFELFTRIVANEPFDVGYLLLSLSFSF